MNKEENLRIAKLTLDTLNNFVCEHRDCSHGRTEATHVTSDIDVACDEHAKEYDKVQKFEDYCHNTLPAALQLSHNLAHNYEGTNINASLTECRGTLRAYSEKEEDGIEISKTLTMSLVGMGADDMQELEKKIVTKLLE